MKNLQPINDSRNSFYNKAEVQETPTKKILFSYGTKVLTIENGKAKLNNKVEDFLLFSNTTLRHIKEFLKQNGFKAETKKQIINDYMEV
jgi:hypothetical protein